MSLITCTDNCIYQKDGLCLLDHCTQPGNPSQKHPCVHYLPVIPLQGAAAPGQYFGPAEVLDGTSP